MVSIRISLFLSWRLSKFAGKKLSFLGRLLSPFFPELSRELELLETGVNDSEYVVMALFNSLLYSLLLLILISAILFWRYKEKFFSPDALFPSAAAFALLSLFFLYYPKILLRKTMEAVDRDLIFALKDLSAQMASGISLYEGMLNVSKSGYGLVSKEFEYVVKDIGAGMPEEQALSKMIDRTESPYIKKTIWQVVSVLRSGASIQAALASIVDSLNQYQNEKITNYIQEMNLWVLLYLIVAVAIPSLGATLLVVLSSLSGTSLSAEAFGMLLLACFLSEIVIIKYIKVKRPIVHM